MRIAVLVLLLLLAAVSNASANAGEVYVLTWKGAVTPVMAGYLDRGIRAAEEGNAAAVVVQLDTPGGLDSAMRDVVQRINSARVPVVVYVAPAGARAASAGAFITMAAHVAAMAPNTAIGAAHPVAGGGEEITGPMKDKVVNDSVAYIRGIAEMRGRNQDWAEKAVRESISSPAETAMQERVVDLIAPTLPDLVRQLEGRKVKLLTTETTLAVTGTEARRVDQTPIEAFLGAIADPNVAYLLLSIAMLAIFLELSNPGAILPGIVGGVCLLMALFALGMLPVNIAGLLFMGLAFLLFVLEVWVPSHGMLGLGGVISLLFGSFILMSGAPTDLQIHPGLILGVVAFFAAIFFLISRAVVTTWRQRSPAKQMVEVGTEGIARTALNPVGTVMVHGELWRARVKEGRVAAGERVVVTGVRGLELEVAALSPAASPPQPAT
jgi:membrane-bound serine protease (ClpP class)